MYFHSDVNKQSNEHNMYNINLLKETLGNNVCNELLLGHAYSGCDLTSRIFGIRKKSAFRKRVKSDPVMKFCASAFILQHKSQEDISDLGKDLMVDLFGGKSNDTLSSLRHIIFTKKVATAQVFVTPESWTASPQHRLQQDSIANVCTFKSWYGLGWQMK
jgi:hypothetical protein